MRASTRFTLHAMVIASIFTVGVSALPAFAKDKQPATPKFSVAQQSQTPVFVVTNSTKKAKTVNLEFDLVDAQGVKEYSYIQNNQTLKRGASQTYNMGSLMLTPAGSPYHVVFTVTGTGKKHRVIETINPAGTFAVYHGGCAGPYCH